MSLTQLILKEHLAEGELVPGKNICIRIDQTLLPETGHQFRSLKF